MRLTKEEKQLLRDEFSKTWRNAKSVEYAVNKTSGYAEIGDCIVTFDKPSIETRFCFGEHGYDYDEAGKFCREMSQSEEYFIRENMRHFDDLQESIDEARDGHADAWLCHYDDTSDLGYVTFIRLGWLDRPRGKNPLKLTAEGLDAYEELITDERAKFEKRLRTYLKRYGLSKCRYWTYWADR